MTQPPGPTRRTRRARRVTIEAFDAMRQGDPSTQRSSISADEASVPETDGDEVLDVAPVLQESRDLEVPYDARFAGADYLNAPGLRRVALGLIMRDATLRHLQEQRLEYLWRRRGGVARGIPHAGECLLPSGLSKHAWNAMAQGRTGSLTEEVVYVIWLAADHLQNSTPLQVEATLYRQLLKTGLNTRGRGGENRSRYVLRSPDVICFRQELLRYGLYATSLLEAAPAFAQASRPDQTTQHALFDPPVPTPSPSSGNGEGNGSVSDVDMTSAPEVAANLHASEGHDDDDNF